MSMTKKEEQPKVEQAATELARYWADQHWMPWALLCQHDRVADPEPNETLAALARKSVW